MLKKKKKFSKQKSEEKGIKLQKLEYFAEKNRHPSDETSYHEQDNKIRQTNTCSKINMGVFGRAFGMGNTFQFGVFKLLRCT